ncbi:MAG: tetratricopeptide repeat protein [Cyanobacteriota bacterium]|nr:tetratricopeptide repeat protein [Cyanobacteriota bacterium]
MQNSPSSLKASLSWLGLFALLSAIAIAPTWAKNLPAFARFAQSNTDFERWVDGCYQLSGEEGLAACDRALEVAPEDATLWTNRGTLLGSLGRYEEALNSDERALALEPDYSLALYNRCLTFNRLERYEDALESCEGALAGNGRWGDASGVLAWDSLGFALSQLGRYKESLEARDRALELESRDPITWFNRGVVLEKLQRFRDAIASYDEALKLDPDYEAARNNREILLNELGEL